MTDVHFVFHAADALRASCALALRCLRLGQTLAIYCPDATRRLRLDQLLWEYPRTCFVPHAQADEPNAGHCRIRLYATRPDRGRWWLNLTPACLPDPPTDSCLLEVVTGDTSDIEQARQRWRDYQTQGHRLYAHDLNRNQFPPLL